MTPTETGCDHICYQFATTDSDRDPLAIRSHNTTLCGTVTTIKLVAHILYPIRCLASPSIRQKLALAIVWIAASDIP